MEELSQKSSVEIGSGQIDYMNNSRITDSSYLSRGCTAEDLVNTVIMTVLQTAL